MKAGERYGDWIVVGDKPIGEGGNSVVWRVKGPAADEAAIKLLTRFDRYTRFRDEVGFQQTHSNHPGILPLLDAYLPESPNRRDRPWLVTPWARPIRRHVEESDDQFLTAVNVVWEVARTVVEIHAAEGAHRDLKPENLFVRGGRAVIGDFGLVSYPGKDAVTASGERLGPIHYVAPELIGNADEPTDYRPGDVYALAKTLWVLATGQRYPLPGHLVATEKVVQLGSYVLAERAVLLDRLLDAATRLRPEQRPSCADFARELQAWLEQKPTVVVTSTLPAGAVARLRALVETAEQARDARRIAAEETERLLTLLHTKLIEIGEEVAAAAGIRSSSAQLPDGNTNGSLRYFPYRDPKVPSGGGNRCFVESFETAAGRTVVLVGCAVLEATPSGTGLLQGGLVIAGNDRDTEFLVKREYEFRLGSALQEASIAQYLSELRAGLPPAVDRLTAVLAAENET
jgi:hypothetical protein